MALASYGVPAGSVIDQRAEGGTDSPHYQIRIRGGDADFRVAVNVLSQEKPAELLYVADENFLHPVTQNLPGLPDGFTPLASQPGGMALVAAPRSGLGVPARPGAWGSICITRPAADGGTG
jgi:uncharacterized protein YukJ